MDHWATLPHVWVHTDLPGLRESGAFTYDGFPLSSLPPVPNNLDDELKWLFQYGTAHPEEGLNVPDRYIDRKSSEAIAMAAQAGVDLPRSFRRFLESEDLQSRVRSSTACFVDPGEKIVRTIGSLPGSLIHFLSDSQSVAHWYLHVLPTGEAAVLESPELFCYLPENVEWIENPLCRQEEIEVAAAPFVFCAPSFSEFLFRFWVENEIWFKLTDKPKRRLAEPFEVKYARHYKPGWDDSNLAEANS
jgi:hypothetical protein